MTAPCVWCGETLTFHPGYGWAHAGGGCYVMRCPDCGWTGAPRPSPVTCPGCGSRQLRDDHCALAGATK